MSQQLLSSENNGQILTDRDSRKHVDRYLRQTMRPGFFSQLAFRLQDPFTGKNGFRLNPFWMSLAVLLLFALSVFLYFNFVRP